VIGLPALAAPFGAMSWVLRIGSVGVAISSLELLRRRAELGPGGLLDGEIPLARARWLLPLSFLAPPGPAVALTGVRLAAACAVIADAGNFEVARAGAIVIAVTTQLLRFRSPLSVHAASSIVMITFTAAALGLAAGTRLSLVFALWFIAAQACLAYFVAGASKLAESSWRSGRTLRLLSGTLIYGNRHRAVMLESHRRIALALSWGTMLGECSVPLTLVVPLPLALVLLGCAGAFHVITAVEMGVNNFVWGFVSTYPAIIFCWYWLHGVPA
jgi:hypothetical protein